MAQARPTVRGEALALAGDAAGRTLLVGSPAWYAWLADATTFAFSGEGGRFTARREKAGSGRGGWYWKAYRRLGLGGPAGQTACHAHEGPWRGAQAPGPPTRR